MTAPTNTDVRRRPRPGVPTQPHKTQPPKTPVRPASPVRPPGPGRSGRPVKTSATTTGQRIQAHLPLTNGAGQVSQVRRTSFVLLVLGLLGGGLVCLLVVNTTLAASSIEIRNLQRQNAVRSEQVQELQQQVAAARSASMIAKEARRLGMRPVPELIFLDLRTNSIEAPRGAAAAALAARLAAGSPTGGQAGVKKPKRGRPGQ